MIGDIRANASHVIATIESAIDAVVTIDEMSLTGASGSIASVNITGIRGIATVPLHEAAVTSPGVARIDGAGISVITDLRLVLTTSRGVAGDSVA
jgi:hypothetical protein